MKFLPESHTDFVFALAPGKFDVALGLVLVALFVLIVIRMRIRANRNNRT